jgi:hypothetical protein
MPEQYYYTGMKAVSGSIATYSPTDLRADSDLVLVLNH